MNNINGITVRFDGLVSYADGSKGPFAASFDGRYHVAQFVDEQVNAQGFLSDADRVAKLDTALGGVTLLNAPVDDPKHGTIIGAYLTFSCIVAYGDNTNRSFTVVFDRGDARLIGSHEALIDVMNNDTYLEHINKVLQDASGAELSLVIE